MKKSRMASRIYGLAVAAAVSAAIGFFVARVVSAVGPYWGTDAFQLAAANMVPAILADPLGVDWTRAMNKVAFGIGFGAPMLIILKSTLEGMKLDNEDTEHAHGDSRLATEAEMKAIADSRRFANTRWISAHAGLPVAGLDEKTKATLDGRNHNQVCYGISGLGKTYNGVWPDKMGAVGEYLPSFPCARRNQVDRMLGKSPYPAEFAGGVDGRNIDAFRNWCAGKADQTREEHLAKASKYPEALRKKWGVGAFCEGYDVFCTDPKGEDLAELGWMYEAAGFDIKSLDVVSLDSDDPSYRARRYNPLARIRERWVDVKAASDVECSAAFSARLSDGRTLADSLDLSGETAEERGGVDERKLTGELSARAGMELRTETLTWQKIAHDEEYERLSAEAAKLRATGKASDLRKAAELMKQAEDHANLPLKGHWTVPRRPAAGDRFAMNEPREMIAPEIAQDPEYAVRDPARATVMKVVEGFSYKQTGGKVVLEMCNKSGAYAEMLECRFKLDDGLEISEFSANAGEIIWPTDASGAQTTKGEAVWRVAGVPAPAPGAAPELFALEMTVRMRSMRVPDSVALTKVVNTLVSNLGGTDAKSNGSSDPFWEDTKRLCFMALIAWLFERYPDAKYRTIPEMIGFLDLVIKDRQPEAESQMDVLIKRWRDGRQWVAGEAEQVAGTRGVSAGGHWEDTAAGPHSSERSLAVSCYNAFRTAAPETVLSIVISCQAALVNLRSEKVRDMLSADELELSTLGEAGQRQIVFCIIPDTVSPYDFITALVVEEAIDVLMTKAANKHGGKLPRHVRFILDEVANIGKLPSLARAIAVVRSRNVSISLYLQSKSQLADNYGKETAETIENNCTSVVFLGSQSNEMLKEMSERVGNETVFSRVMQRSFSQGSMSGNSSESISSSERPVMSAAQIAHLQKGKLLAFVFNAPGAILDDKFPTARHPLYPYVSPGWDRKGDQPPALFREKFKYADYLERERAREAARDAAEASAPRAA